MAAYADISFYTNNYRQNAPGGIADSEFLYYAQKATKEIRARTFGNIDEHGPVLEEVQMCCCEVAEKLHDLGSAKGDNGMVLQSYSNDGDSGTFQAAELSQEGMREAIDQIARSWLTNTGLMFCGRRGRH